MKIFLIIFGIYIGMVILSLLYPYVDFRNNYCIKGEKYVLKDLYNRSDRIYWVCCFIPFFNIIIVLYSLICLFIDMMKNIRIV